MASFPQKMDDVQKKIMVYCVVCKEESGERKLLHFSRGLKPHCYSTIITSLQLKFMGKMKWMLNTKRHCSDSGYLDHNNVCVGVVQRKMSLKRVEWQYYTITCQEFYGDGMIFLASFSMVVSQNCCSDSLSVCFCRDHSSTTIFVQRRRHCLREWQVYDRFLAFSCLGFHTSAEHKSGFFSAHDLYHVWSRAAPVNFSFRIFSSFARIFYQWTQTGSYMIQFHQSGVKISLLQFLQTQNRSGWLEKMLLSAGISNSTRRQFILCGWKQFWVGVHLANLQWRVSSEKE